MPLNILHVVRDLDVASGGPSRSVPALAAHQARLGETRVSVVFQDRGREMVPTNSEVVTFSAIKGSAILGTNPLREFLNRDGGPDVLHLHGLWSPLLYRAARVARSRSIPYVVSVRGMLSGWAFGHRAWKKRPAWALYQRQDLAAAACLVASSAFEAEDIAALVPGSRVEVLPNGCEPMPAGLSAASDTPPADETRWAFALGRLHPVKGYAELIEAWAQLRPAGWKLAIAGPDEDRYRSRLASLIDRLNLGDVVQLVGAVDDAEKWAWLKRSELFVAPSKTENFGMAIAEALQSGTPVVTTTGTPWRELRERDCGLWVEPDAQSLRAALREALNSAPDRLRAMGARGRELIESEYAWPAVAARSIALYRSVLPAGAAA